MNYLLKTYRFVLVFLGLFFTLTSMRAQSYAVYNEKGGTLSLCNNIIVANIKAEATNIEYLPPSNYVKSGIVLFKDSLQDFSLRELAPSIDMGNNTCTDILLDFKGRQRIKQEKVDAGAYESPLKLQRHAVYQEPNGALNFCNNIIINNGSLTNVNTKNVPTYNIIKNTNAIFKNNLNDFMPLAGATSINAGYNA